MRIKIKSTKKKFIQIPLIGKWVPNNQNHIGAKIKYPLDIY